MSFRASHTKQRNAVHEGGIDPVHGHEMLIRARRRHHGNVAKIMAGTHRAQLGTLAEREIRDDKSHQRR